MKRTYLDHIKTLDPVRDHQEIVHIDTQFEFPFDTTRSLEFALFRTYAVPSIGALLACTGEFIEHAQKRYDDTDLIVSEIGEHGYDSERGRAAIRRMNQLHGRYEIANDDFQYVLSTFVFEPARWMARFGWRPMIEVEKQAWFYFWREVGRRMNIKHVPDTREAFERFNIDYERTHFRFTEASQRVASGTRDLLLGWFLPGSLKRLGEPFVYALLDQPLLTAFGYPHQSETLRHIVQGALRLRARCVRALPERTHPVMRTALKRPTYPNGYTIEALGPVQPKRCPFHAPLKAPLKHDPQPMHTQ